METLHRLSLSCLLAAAASAALLTASLQAQTPAQTSEEQAVLAPVKALFDGMTKRDSAIIKETFIPGATMINMRDGTPDQMTLDAFADRISGHPIHPNTVKIEERIHDPLIRIDNDLAVVWAPFDFFVDGKLDHCGTDLFNLVRKDGKWLIASLADTGRKDCPAK